jgi:hypothetical protein
MIIIGLIVGNNPEVFNLVLEGLIIENDREFFQRTFTDGGICGIVVDLQVLVLFGDKKCEPVREETFFVDSGNGLIECIQIV